ncbi:patatin-like phospholipase family protein [Pseudophaeobacter sp. EL27]|uniref:patatin-like phospholipase family protein n=1 Tax=Pseudophaeobacter sp. EL27 TaxID=2107580 RepID=UPI0013C481F7|nr:patatin-like phospholipase family protein [Pseudophaeobacter sp. EL27]
MRECDLIMKGGTTSGVVYPQAIYRIGKDYRLRSVGGTSAGAIAATVAAAAEYRRQTSPDQDDETGFDQIAALSDELGDNLTRYLQPSKDLAPFFEAFIEYQELKQKEKKPSWFKLIKVIWPKLKSYRRKPLRNGSLIAAGGVVAGVAGGGIGLGILGVGAGLAWGVVQLVLSLIKTISAQLKANDYGMVPGTTQPGVGDGKTQAISDWLADRVDKIAGHWQDSPPKTPLTLGDLQKGRGDQAPGIALSTMTTDLTSRRPYSLPLKMPGYFFNPHEFEKILPKRVVDYMVQVGNGGKSTGPEGKELYPMPLGGDFPVVLMARMSLSFPILLQAVPLYRQDKAKNGGKSWVRCLFSDGGIASNLPVHFFDAWLPRRPTFAISLDSFDKTRHSETEDRIHFDQGIRDRLHLPVQPITGLLGFLASIFNTAKDWQDKLQAEVPGMYERVVTVRLEPHQGGSNIAMPPEVIKQLKDYGAEAGRKLVDEFDFDENRWRRALCLLPELEKALPGMHDAIKTHRAGPENWTYEELARLHQSDFYPPKTPNWPAEVLEPALDELADLGERIDAKDDAQMVSGGVTPDYDAGLRLVASPDLSPGGNAAGGTGV